MNSRAQEHVFCSALPYAAGYKTLTLGKRYAQDGTKEDFSEVRSESKESKSIVLLLTSGTKNSALLCFYLLKNYKQIIAAKRSTHTYVVQTIIQFGHWKRHCEAARSCKLHGPRKH